MTRALLGFIIALPLLSCMSPEARSEEPGAALTSDAAASSQAAEAERSDTKPAAPQPANAQEPPEQTQPEPESIPLAEAARHGLHLVVKKKARRLEVYARPGSGGGQEKLVRSYRVGLGFAPEGDKVRQGDGKTPEGSFRVTRRLPHSQFYKAFLISYPEVEDAERGLRDGLISAGQAESIKGAHRREAPPPSGTRLGGLIEIHGRGSSSDWTLGCVAVEDEVMDELWEHVPVGTKVTIQP